MSLNIKSEYSSSVKTPATGKVAIFHSPVDGNLKLKNPNGTVEDVGGIHATTHYSGGNDVLYIENLGSLTTSSNLLVATDGAGGLQLVASSSGIGSHYLSGAYHIGNLPEDRIIFSGSGHSHSGDTDGKNISYNNLTDIPSSFTPSAHSASHYSGNTDTLNIENLGTTETGSNLFLVTSGSNGVKLVNFRAQQEKVLSLNISGEDQNITPGLQYMPFNKESITFFVNGLTQEQSADGEYLPLDSNPQILRWLVNSGQAENLETTDRLIAKYHTIEPKAPPPVLTYQSGTWTSLTLSHSIAHPNNFTGVFPGNKPALKYISGKCFQQIESEAINTLLRSQEHNVSPWSETRLGVSGNHGFAPDGSVTADKLVENSDNNTHYLEQAVDFISGTVYCFSSFIKASERTEVRMCFDGSAFSGTPRTIFNLSAGITSSGADIDQNGIDPMGNGWYRCWFSATAVSSSSANARFNLVDNEAILYQGDGNSGLYVWQSQVEYDAWSALYPSSPMQTSDTPVTRSEDQLLFYGASIPSSSRGPISIDYIPYFDSNNAKTSTAYILDFNAEGSSHRIILYYHKTSKFFRVSDITSGSTMVQTTNTEFDRFQRMTITIDPTTGSLVLEGAASGSGIYYGTPWETTIGNLSIGRSIGGAAHCNGLISEPIVSGAR